MFSNKYEQIPTASWPNAFEPIPEAREVPSSDNRFTKGFIMGMGLTALVGTLAYTSTGHAVTEKSDLFVVPTAGRGESKMPLRVGGGGIGGQMKPTPDGGWKLAGEHPTEFKLEMDNGARALVDTKTANAVQWTDAQGVTVLNGAGIVHEFPRVGVPIAGEFVPEERAKKLSFDRMIFKCNPQGMEDIEYRVDVTLREASVEYDVIIKNAGDQSYNVEVGLGINLTPEALAAGYTVTGSGYTDISTAGAGAAIQIPVGKFQETAFYLKVSK